MGCADASGLARAVWAVVRPHIDPRSRQKVACEFITTFTEQGLSGLEECTQLQKDKTIDPDHVLDDWASDDDFYYDEYEDEHYNEDGFDDEWEDE